MVVRGLAMRVGINGEGVRRRLTAAEKAAVLEEAFGPGGSVAETADRLRISTAAIYLWRRQAIDGGLPAAVRAAAATPAFVPVRVSAHTGASARIEIALGNGRIVKADASVDPAVLAAIVEALDGHAA